MSKQYKAAGLALLAVLFWSTIGSAFKITLNYLNYTQILLYASFISVVYLTILLLVSGKIGRILHITAKSAGMSAIMGLLNPFAYYLILLKAYSILPAQEAVVLNYTWPMILVLLSAIFLRTAISRRSILALMVSFSGTFVIATQGNVQSFQFSNPVGVGLALSSAFFWAAYWLLNLKDSRESEEKIFLNFTFGFIYTLIYCILTGNLELPGPEATAGVVYIGLFEMGVTFVIWMKALKTSENTAAIGNLVYLSPFLSLLFVSVSVGEKIMASTIVGLFLIVGGILLQQFPVKKS